jgi:hypothetical protein
MLAIQEPVRKVFCTIRNSVPAPAVRVPVILTGQLVCRHHIVSRAVKHLQGIIVEVFIRTEGSISGIYLKAAGF